MLQNSVMTPINIVSLCYFGCSTENDIVYTSQEGHILRTKTVGTNEGGVATGFSVLDSPLLVTPDQVNEFTGPITWCC